MGLHLNTKLPNGTYVDDELVGNVILRYFPKKGVVLGKKVEDPQKYELDMLRRMYEDEIRELFGEREVLRDFGLET